LPIDELATGKSNHCEDNKWNEMERNYHFPLVAGLYSMINIQGYS